MADLPLQPLKPSEVFIRDKVSTIKTANFTQIPSWVSLNRCSSSIKTQQNQRGLVENLHLVSLSKLGKLKEAHEFLNKMDMAGISVDTHSYECLFETCGNLRSLSDGKLIHNRLRRKVKSPYGFLENCLLRMYSDCGSLIDAQKLFDEMHRKNWVSWAIMVAGIRPNTSVYISLIRAFPDPSCIDLGKQIHSHAIRMGLTPDLLIDTSLSNMYMKCGCLESSKLIFNWMPEKNVVTWTGLMLGYTQSEKQEEALGLFSRMIREGVQLDDLVFSVVLKACSRLKDLETGRQIHGFIVKLGIDSEVSAGTPLVDFYVKCGNLEDARRAFERISDPNDVSWSAIISGYSQTGQFEECVVTFKSVRSRGAALNSFIYTSIFQVCSALADLNLGTQVHGDAIKRGLFSDLYGGSALITMYSRSGRIDCARRAFELINEPDTVAWTAIIAGCAYYGIASEALKLFRRMQSCGVMPNAVTFVGVFTACSHSGLVSEAREYLDLMSSEYGVDPTIDHYDCMVDIYSRAGQLEEAIKLIRTMPFEPDAMSWKSLLGGCWNHRNLKLGKIAAANLLQLDPEDTAGYILIFNLYASFGKWEEAAHVRKVMAERDLRKEVGCSWITVKGKVHRFIVGDRHHLRTKEIYSKLEELTPSGINNGSTLFTDDNDESCSLPKRKEQLLDHSERLAIAFGLISKPKTPADSITLSTGSVLVVITGDPMQLGIDLLILAEFHDYLVALLKGISIAIFVVTSHHPGCGPSQPTDASCAEDGAQVHGYHDPGCRFHLRRLPTGSNSPRLRSANTWRQRYQASHDGLQQSLQLLLLGCQLLHHNGQNGRLDWPSATCGPCWVPMWIVDNDYVGFLLDELVGRGLARPTCPLVIRTTLDSNLVHVEE
ncbi:hypothetical protein HHK36_007635 [Tetracentron sinense]|uniref:Pentatricopeptide repeat-containing protein n=1 Tax=Tetracentron sinense TaxID=13715 RepID=A0A834ZMS6_TETSI|nr:hypothetical protein HHK36_007635 [Tetracentron sinense]